MTVRRDVMCGIMRTAIQCKNEKYAGTEQKPPLRYIFVCENQIIEKITHLSDKYNYNELTKSVK